MPLEAARNAAANIWQILSSSLFITLLNENLIFLLKFGRIICTKLTYKANIYFQIISHTYLSQASRNGTLDLISNNLGVSNLGDLLKYFMKVLSSFGRLWGSILNHVTRKFVAIMCAKLPSKTNIYFRLFYPHICSNFQMILLWL